jgi:hypothetical protein
MQEFAQWDSFYLIIGGAAGALIGLQFVVMTLIAGRTDTAPPEVGAAFSTPTVVHFTAVLFISALARVPWPSITQAAVIGGLIGVAGAIYVIRIHLLIRKQDRYEPVFEDWFFHCILPLFAYLAFVVLAVMTLSSNSNVHIGLYGTAAAVFTLLFTGIHNAWDAVTWQVFAKPAESEPPASAGGQSPDD